MFTLGIDLLMKRAVISRWDNREDSEWPPHPDRVYMALVAAWGESGEDADGKAALQWLEALGSPSLRVSTQTCKRTSYTNFVPVNDHCSPISKKGKTETPLGSIPFGRARNARFFPAVVPEEPFFHLIWPDISLEQAHQIALDRLCSQVTYLGHSSTPIRMWVETQTMEANLIPTDGDAPFRFRVFGSGRLANLEARFNGAAVEDHSQLSRLIEQLRAETKVARGTLQKELKAKLAEVEGLRIERYGDVAPQTLRPVPSMWQGYCPPKSGEGENVIEGPFDPGLIVFRQVGGGKLPLESCGTIANAFRGALMKRFGKDPPEWLSGHAKDNSPSTLRRLTYLPLGFVGREHSDGHLMGVALALPRNFPEEQVDLLYQLLGRHDGKNPHDIEPGIPFISLKFQSPGLEGTLEVLELELDETCERSPKYNLRPSTWCKPATCWVTVTPLVMPLVPRRSLTPEVVIGRACTDAGYPEPIAVRASLAPLIPGVPHVKSFHFPFDPHTRRPRRPITHAEIQFAEPIRGPVIIGAGRYAGFGLCRPSLKEKNS